MANEYVLVERTSKLGKNGVTFWRFTFYCLEDGQFWETTVDNTYDNFHKSGWNLLVDDDMPYGIYTGLTRTRRFTREGFPVITADSRPRITSRCEDYDEAMKIVCEHQGIPFPGSRNQYKELFDVSRT